MADNGPKIIAALDFPDSEQAFRLVERLSPERCRLKVGKELFVRGGPRLVEQLAADGYDVFLDLKFHDIPNTVARACEAAADLGVWMVNLHALGGRRMMEAAREALDKRQRRPLLIGVTILTSMGSEDLKEIQLPEDPEANVLHLARLAQRAGLDGVVCSPKEVAGLRREIAGEFRRVTPGIRPAWAATDDQKRITTPSDAIRLGSDYLVIGRPITAASDPLEALRKIEEELGV
ncbi:orotidine-5'-phosphate decarboxylase [Thiohalomonas denitrificans]|uniref:Orotidine 5'-phosphate decarboxylase n=1 Tax=Thiohalomonas denitrificans TaxID=415747 RepID=A0A1G5PIG0_9GAMM|nr:orotidine-5'-phosphate decarboxylase [Thiohalomonas denitrificans]SCZ49188.1 orotidine-5'-phosphate decarboxylase [Thiohalomonas denitrificans]